MYTKQTERCSGVANHLFQNSRTAVPPFLWDAGQNAPIVQILQCVVDLHCDTAAAFLQPQCTIGQHGFLRSRLHP